jgi:hypothetical protein
MTDRVFEPDEGNPFAQFRPAQAAPAVGLPKADNDDERDDDNPFRQFRPNSAPSEEPSATGVFIRSAARGVLPAIGSLPAIGAGAELGAAGGAVVGGPFGALLGGAAGGIAGAVGGASAISAVQDWALAKLPDSWREAIGMDERQQKLDEANAPTASFLGGLAPYAITMRPGLGATKALAENSTAIERILAHPMTARVFGGGVMGGMELGQEAIGGEPTDWRRVAISTGFGVVFNKPTRIGEAITEIGARPARRVMGLAERPVPAAEAPVTEAAQAAPTQTAETESPVAATSGIAPSLFHVASVPTVADAADVKVMGPGISEAVFMGSHDQDRASELTARDTKRTEQSILGPSPAPDAHSLARQMHFDLFASYDALRERRRMLEGEPGAAAPLAATEAELAKIEPEVQAAYRRAADAAGAEIREAVPETAPPPPAPAVRSIEDQRDHIVNEVKQSLIDAGRPSEEAQAAAQLVAARYEARAARFNGALGTPQELFDRESSDIRRMERVAKNTRRLANPNSARALDDFQERMAQAKELRRKAMEAGGGAAKITSTAERFAGVTEDEWKAQLEDSIEALEPEERQSVRDDLSHLPAEDLAYIAERAEAGLPLFQAPIAPTSIPPSSAPSRHPNRTRPLPPNGLA